MKDDRRRDDTPDGVPLTRRSLLRGTASLLAAGGAGSLLAACGSGSSSQSLGSTTTKLSGGGSPVRGGTLRVGMSTGGSSDTLDPHAAVSTVDAARAGNLFDRLTVIGTGNKVRMQLAESMQPNRQATTWTIRLRDGVTWHDGSPLTADDVIYTLRRIGDPKSAAAGKAKVAVIDLKGLKKLDARTVQVPLKKPIADLAPTFAIFYMAIIKNGTTAADLKSHPIGTGPFMYKSFSPGKNSLFVRNPHYWDAGKPYVEQLALDSITDSTARLNALIGGQVDMIEALEFAQAKAEQNAGRIVVAQTSPGQIVPMTMRVDVKPFDDVRVRQALRLIADRPALVRTAQLGVGDMANDLFGKGLPYYASDLPQRHQDIEQAKSLLKQAGQSNLTVELNTSKVAPGMLESATAFAEQAKAAAVTVKLNRVPDGDFYGANYLKYPFGMTQWTSQPIPSWLQDAVVTGAAYNETHWFRPSFDTLVQEAQGELDAAKRSDKYHQIQQILYDQGGYLIWGDQPFLDGLSKKVGGFVPISAQALGNYFFQNYWLHA